MMLTVFSLSADTNTILFSGIAFHKDNADRWGEEFNEKNYGIGYRYSQNKKALILSYNALIIQDSYANSMYNLSIGLGYNIIDINNIGINIGLEGGISSKKVKYGDSDFNREIIPLLFPTATIYIKEFSLNIIFIPEIKHKDKKVDQSTYINIGYSF